MNENECKYCSNNFFGRTTNLLYNDKDEGNGDVTMAMWIYEDIIRFYTWGYGSRKDYSIVINYCPMCGRKLEKMEVDRK